MHATPLRDALTAGRPAFGLWAALPTGLTAELAGRIGVDYVCVDQQHGAIDDGATLGVFQAVTAGGATPVARVAQNDPWLIMRALDLGALAVIVPLVNSAEEAARAVSACRFPPTGTRSFGPIRATTVVGSAEPARLNAAVMCFAMIETREGLDRVEEIAATPGLDGLYIGPSDLALGLGLAPTAEPREPAHLAAVELVRRACERAGIVAAMHTHSGEVAARAATQGFAMITIAVDYLLFTEGLGHALAAARAASGQA